MNKNLLKNTKAISTSGAAIVITGLLVVSLMTGLFLHGQGYFTPTTPTPPGTPSGPSTGTPNYGSFAISCGGVSSLSPTTTYTYTTDYTVNWVSLRTGVAQVLNPSGDGTDTILVDPADNGYVYAVVKPVDDKNLYVDPAAIMEKNTFVVPGSATYGPVFGDGVNYWYFKYNLNTQMPAPALGVAPTYPFTAYFKAYETITLNTPADVESIGTASVDVPVRWEASFSNVNRAVAISKVSLTLNTTDSTKVTIKALNVPGFRTLNALDFNPPVEGLNSLRYDFVLSNSLAGAAFAQYTSGTLNVLDFGTTFTCSLSDDDLVTATLSIYTLDENGKQVAAITDTVNLAEDSI